MPPWAWDRGAWSAGACGRWHQQPHLSCCSVAKCSWESSAMCCRHTVAASAGAWGREHDSSRFLCTKRVKLARKRMIQGKKQDPASCPAVALPHRASAPSLNVCLQDTTYLRLCHAEPFLAGPASASSISTSRASPLFLLLPSSQLSLCFRQLSRSN